MALRSILVTLFFAYTFFDYTESTSAKSGVTCQFKVFPNNPNLYYEIVYSGGYLVRQCHFGSKFSVSRCSCSNKTDTKAKDGSAKKKMKGAQKTSKSGLGSNKATQHILKTKITIKKFPNLPPVTSTPTASTTTRRGGKLKKFATKLTQIQSVVLTLSKSANKSAAATNSSKREHGSRAAIAEKTKSGQGTRTAELAAEVLQSPNNKSGLVVLDADTSASRERSAEASSASNESDTSLSASEEEEPASKVVTTKAPISINKTCALNANAENPTKYYELVPGHGYYIRDCAEGSAFSPIACGCTIHAKKEKEDKPESKEMWKKPLKEELATIMQPPTILPTEAAKKSYVYIPVCQRSSCVDDPTKYFEQVPGHGFYLRSCPKGTAFNPIHCQCSIHYGNSGRVIFKFRNNEEEAEAEESKRNDEENDQVADDNEDNAGEEEEEEEEEEEREPVEEEEGESKKTNVGSLLLNLLSAAERKYGSLCNLQTFLGDSTKYYNPIARVGHRVLHCAKGLVFKFEYCRCVRKKVTIHWKKILPYIYI
ncbi:uncharacterized protein LOC118768312 isoform X2 [Octopus sinensis]|nr:uncharacterized protein LOC118768312 isoform X2 [Octopus sinensis]